MNLSSLLTSKLNDANSTKNFHANFKQMKTRKHTNGTHSLSVCEWSGEQWDRAHTKMYFGWLNSSVNGLDILPLKWSRLTSNEWCYVICCSTICTSIYLNVCVRARVCLCVCFYALSSHKTLPLYFNEFQRFFRCGSIRLASRCDALYTLFQPEQINKRQEQLLKHHTTMPMSKIHRITRIQRRWNVSYEQCALQIFIIVQV